MYIHLRSSGIGDYSAVKLQTVSANFLASHTITTSSSRPSQCPPGAAERAETGGNFNARQNSTTLCSIAQLYVRTEKLNATNDVIYKRGNKIYFGLYIHCPDEERANSIFTV